MKFKTVEEYRKTGFFENLPMKQNKFTVMNNSVMIEEITRNNPDNLDIVEMIRIIFKKDIEKEKVNVSVKILTKDLKTGHEEKQKDLQYNSDFYIKRNYSIKEIVMAWTIDSLNRLYSYDSLTPEEKRDYGGYYVSYRRGDKNFLHNEKIIPMMRQALDVIRSLCGRFWYRGLVLDEDIYYLND